MKQRIFILMMLFEVLILASMVIAGHFSAIHREPVRRCNRQLVRMFDLTDLAIWTGARYTRHVSQADIFSAFQDSMGALEHFPEGTLAPLPLPIRPSEPATSAATAPVEAALSEKRNEPSS